MAERPDLRRLTREELWAWQEEQLNRSSAEFEGRERPPVSAAKRDLPMRLDRVGWGVPLTAGLRVVLTIPGYDAPALARTAGLADVDDRGPLALLVDLPSTGPGRPQSAPTRWALRRVARGAVWAHDRDADTCIVEHRAEPVLAWPVTSSPPHEPDDPAPEGHPAVPAPMEGVEQWGIRGATVDDPWPRTDDKDADE